MTALIIVLGAGFFAQTLVLGMILLELRNDRHTANLRESTRRQWEREEHHDKGA